MSNKQLIKKIRNLSRINTKNRETRFVTGIGTAGFTELILTPNEAKKLEEVKLHLVGKMVNLIPQAFNRTNEVGEILDIRIVVTRNRIYPCAVINFPSAKFYILRGLKELVNSSDYLLEPAPIK